jgi:hypothetical protein
MLRACCSVSARIDTALIAVGASPPFATTSSTAAVAASRRPLASVAATGCAIPSSAGFLILCSNNCSDALVYYHQLSDGETTDQARVDAALGDLARRLLVWWSQRWRTLDLMGLNPR